MNTNYISYSPHRCDPTLTKVSEKEGFILVPGLKGQSIMVGKSQRQDLRQLNALNPAVRKQRYDPGAQLGSSFVLCPGHPTLALCGLLLRMGFPCQRSVF